MFILIAQHQFFMPPNYLFFMVRRRYNSQLIDFIHSSWPDWPIVWSNSYVMHDIFNDILSTFENTINKSNFILSIEFVGGTVLSKNRLFYSNHLREGQIYSTLMS